MTFHKRPDHHADGDYIPAPIEFERIPAVVFEDGSGLTSQEKIKLFISLFVGREDVYAKRWENLWDDRKGYSPDCLHEWDKILCFKNKTKGSSKPKFKCSECPNSDFMPLRPNIIAKHLQGLETIGTYAMRKDETCVFLAVDFDKKSWRLDAVAFVQACRANGIPAYLEISRSGEGAHAWIFFETSIPALTARNLGTALISLTSLHYRQLPLESYDRFFPSQDRMPKGRFGNLIVLPLQGLKRAQGRTVFVSDDLIPYSDQWAYLKTFQKLSMFDVEGLLLKLVGQEDPLDVAFLNQETQQKLLKTPWAKKIDGPLPESLDLVLGKGIHIERSQLTNELQHRLIRLTCFQNRQYYINQRQGFSVRKERRVLSEYKLLAKELTLPRGCLDSVQDLLALNGIAARFEDNRCSGNPITVAFNGTLRPDQQAAFDDMLAFQDGVLCAPPAFGKTVVGAAVIAHRAVSTLIIVGTTILLDQWVERLSQFLRLDDGSIGTLVGGKSKLTGIVDIASEGSLRGLDNLEDVLSQYGQIIIDECHHSAADSYKRSLVLASPVYIMGMTAEDDRSDGHQPLVYMRCGPVRHVAKKSELSPKDLQALIRYRKQVIDLPKDARMCDIHQWLADNETRTMEIVGDVLENYAKGRRCLVLAERVQHVKAVAAQLEGKVNLYIMSGDGKVSASKTSMFAQLAQIPHGMPHVLVATYKKFAEAVDHAPLDTLFLAAPFSFGGRLRQSTGRLDRPEEFKKYAKVYDYVDEGHPTTLKMWTKRRPRYKHLGYRFVAEHEPEDLFGYD